MQCSAATRRSFVRRATKPQRGESIIAQGGVQTEGRTEPWDSRRRTLSPERAKEPSTQKALSPFQGFLLALLRPRVPAPLLGLVTLGYDAFAALRLKMQIAKTPDA
jgi:hypothetical protein